MKKSLICISCPLGCSLDVEYDKNRIKKLMELPVSGGLSMRKKKYLAQKEL